MAESAESIKERLSTGDQTFDRAARQQGARLATVEDFVRASSERGARQTPAICRRAGVAPWLEFRYVTEYQLARLVAVLAGDDLPDEPDEPSPFIHEPTLRETA